MTRPLKSPPARVRQRQRADGVWRIWWEPETALRAAGFEPVELDPARLTWSVREAERLNRLVDQSRGGAPRPQEGGTARGGRNVATLIREYQSSPYWDALKPATQRSYAKNFRLIGGKWGSSLVGDFTEAIVLEWYEALYRTGHRHQASALIRALSILMTYAKRRSWRSNNPCRDMGLKAPKGRARVAKWAELDALFAACEPWPSMGLAIALAVFQGQRQTDLIEARRDAFWLMVKTGPRRRDRERMRLDDVRFATLIAGDGSMIDARGCEVIGGVWAFVRSKRGNHSNIELNWREVSPWLARQRPSDKLELLVYEGTGRAYSADLFRKVWGRVRAAARKSQPFLATLQFRDLRRTFGVLSRAGGASTRDVGDALGNSVWKDPELSGIYMPASDESAGIAVKAIKRPKP